MRVTWLKPEERLLHEFRQLTEQGLEVSELRLEWASSEAANPFERRELAQVLLDRCRMLTEAADHEPDEAQLLVGFAARPVPPVTFSSAELERRIQAAWTGRMAGCLLGKPVEKVPREGIRVLLESAGRWPLTAYFSAEGLPEDVLERYPWNRASRDTSLRENIVCMPEDDDINYAMLNLAVLERHGLDFDSDAIGMAWLEMLPALTVFTAERVAYQNMLAGLEPPETARHHNPYREWIGAQIRADIWGWVSPGDPSRAAELAWRDARLSHTGNGLYAAMLVAAMLAAAFTHSEPRAVVEAGLAVIPTQSRLAEAIRFTLELPARTTDWERAVDELYAWYGQYHWVHAINNAALVSAALLYGAGDFSHSIALAVMGGWDTDCNGATVGSIVATMSGQVPPRWASPLHNRVRSSLRGFDGAQIDDLARRTVAQIPQRYRHD